MLFLQQLLRHKKNRPRHAALVSGARTVSYAELAELVEKGAHYFRQAGIEPRQVAGIAIADEIDHLVASLSLLAGGIHQVTLASYETPPMRRDLAERAGVTHLVSDGSAPHIAPLDIAPLGQVSWPGLDALAALPAPVPATPGGGAMLYLNTTGTTGGSNLIPFSEQQISLQAQRHRDYAEERFLRFAPVEYNTSKRHRLYCVWNGGTNLFRPPGPLASVVEFSASRGVTCLDISKMHVSELIAQNTPAPLAGIKVRPGGSEVPAHIRRDFLEKVSPLLYVRYATTETGAISMAAPFQHDADATCGLPLEGVGIEIIGADGAPLPAGQAGEIRLKTPGMATGYLNNPEQTGLRFRDGWFYPGDIGYLREDGQVVVKGRKDDMINLNGINIFPSDIERVLEQHPAVRAAAALPLNSAVHGQIPVAAVELEAAARITAPELQRFARERLALRAPRRILLMDALPRNNQGKILRQQIRELFEHRKEQS